jgi:hypothetical protein
MTDKQTQKFTFESSDKESSISSERVNKIPSDSISWRDSSSSKKTPILPTSASRDTSSTLPTTGSRDTSSSSIFTSSSSTDDAYVETESLLNKDDLEDDFNGLNCNSENFFSKDCNKFTLKKELLERKDLSENEDKYDFLYPNMNDKDFNSKIAAKKEFNDTKYDGPDFTKSIKEQADILANVDFELQPHQAFVKNFMSFQTPYSSLLLYHGLGSGKTCSAIGVCEEMRDYMKQMGINKRIIIVASENVQDNFKLQLFDERKLKQVNGIWSIKGCIGNKLLKEINPMNMPMSKEKVISQIKSLINTYYLFLGYVQFANYIIKTMNYEEDMKRDMEKKMVKPGEKREKTQIEKFKDINIEFNSKVIRRLRNEFNNRLIVIDEVHNIRKSGDDENKKVAQNLEYLVKAAENMRFLLLSATPMYNNYKEIVWLLNLMNMNDRRGRVDVRDIFDKNGNFKKNGEELLIRKATGYVSFVRGENPYTFPYRVYPSVFASKDTFPAIKYPSYQMNLRKIKHEDKKRILSLYLTKIGECDNCGKCQYCCYKYITNYLRKKQFTKNTESFGYTDLQVPLESLIISYPVPNLKEIVENIPSNIYSDEFSPSFDDINDQIEEDNNKDELEEANEEEKKDEEYPELIEADAQVIDSGDEPEIIFEKVQPIVLKPKNTTRKRKVCKYGERLENGKCPPKPKGVYNNEEEPIVLKPKNTTRKRKDCKYGERLENGKCPPKPNDCKYGERLGNGKCPPKPKDGYNHEEEPTVLKPKNTTRKRKDCKYGERLENGKCPPKPNDCKYGERLENGKCPPKPKDGYNNEEEPIVLKPKNTTRKRRDCKYGERLQNGKCPPKPNDCKYGERLDNGKCPPKPKGVVPTEKSITTSENEYSPEININQRSHQGQATTGGTNTSSSSSSSSLSQGDNYVIKPNILTGKIGLNRMMNFLDNQSVKGSFEYKETTLKNYGKIFSRDEIGKYSSKIKGILDKMYNPETGVVSDGIILIYSQYIDSGLIPMALALEEMGFTRYGQQDIKPLFKKRPSEVVDARTLRPPENRNNFMPARYSMITGDFKLSPNNDFEVKGITGEDNTDGNKVKVVLISKAGSEGIDLKFIRQVHILDPWYNMNRIEQIIGRAVRNFSHKDLPFEKRNVEIYMHGTILDNNIEEAADLYVYRVAEYKAIQIGKVTRILKETAVDCIINHDQTKFTQDIMKANLKEPITQKLSTGEILHNFKVGDAPFSPSCDYMASCNYDCRPDAEIDESKLNEDTYDEKFIAMNSEKILQRIRMLFKEAFFYKKDTLLRSVRTPKEYPYVQIYSALTQLIDDENEFIVDKYGRNGRLINIGDYYLFQPAELKDKNISIFDRSVPLDYKHHMINFELKQNIAKPVINKRHMNKGIIEEEETQFLEGKRIVDEMKVNYDITNEFISENKVPRGDNNWYKHCGIVIQKMSKEYPESRKYLVRFLVAHLLELLLFDEKVNVMNYLYSLDSIPEDSFERFAKEYFENNSVTTTDFTVFIAYKLNKLVILVLEDNKWTDISKSTSTDEREVASSRETKAFLAFDKNDYNNIVGFMGYDRGNAKLDFKTKNMLSSRDTGAICNDAGKAKNMTRLNEIIGENKYTNESTKAIKDTDGNVKSESVGNIELCVFEEFILRFFNQERENNKKWFFTPEMAIYHGLYKIVV